MAVDTFNIRAAEIGIVQRVNEKRRRTNERMGKNKSEKRHIGACISICIYSREDQGEREREREKKTGRGGKIFGNVTQSEWRIEARLKENFHRFSIMDLDRLADSVRWNRRHR